MKSMKMFVAVAPIVAIFALALAQPAAAHPVAETAPLVLAEYVKVHDALASDRVDGVAESATKIEAMATEMIGHAGDAEKQLYEGLAAAATKMKAGDLAALRAPMKELSVAVDAFLRAAGTPGWQLYYCPMADGYWIQTAEGVRNPYYGAKMLACGDKVDKVGA
ncbi:MAG: hypothetical protein AMXMBFR36_04640 [Acidobacteriota bacterium]